MTRLKKLLVAGLMVLVTCCVSIGSAISNITQSIFSWVKASANTDTYKYSNTHSSDTTLDGSVITVKQIPTEATKNEQISIPKDVLYAPFDGDSATVNGDDVKIEIKTPYGVSLVEEDGTISQANSNQLVDASTSYTLTPRQVGVYTVQYAVKNSSGVWTVSNIYQIKVTAESYTLEFAGNDPIVMPDKIDTNQGVDTTVTLKLPKLYDENGEQITEFVLGEESTSFFYLAKYVTLENVWLDADNKPVAYVANDPNAEGKNVYAEYSTYEIEKITDFSKRNDYNYGLAIDVKVPGEDKVSNTLATPVAEDLMTLDGTFTQDKAYYVSVPYTFEANSGKNIVTYKLCKSDFSNYATPDAYLSYTIDGSNSYDSKTIDLGVSTSSNIKSSATSVNEKCYLPKVSAVNKNENKNSVSAYYTYSVKFVDESGKKDVYISTPEYVTMGVDDKGVYFIPHKEGTYNISYNAVDFYGNKDKNTEDYDYDVNVTDRTSPSLFYVQSYDFANYETMEAEKLEDLSYTIPSKYIINTSESSANWTKIAVPAIFTEDNYKAFDELKIKRTITSEEGFINSDEEKVKNFSLDIQDTNGTTDFDAKDTGNKIDVEGIISYNNYEGSTYVVYKNKFYAKDGFSVAGKGTPDEVVTGTELKEAALIQAKTSQTAYITINPNLFGEGEYTIEYSVQDGRYSNNSGKTFTFTLVKDTAANVDNKAPTVKFGTSTIGKVTEDQEITLDKPEIKDEVDSNLLVKYYVVANNKYLEIKLDENKKLTFNTSDEVEAGKTIYQAAAETTEKAFKVVAIAFDDFAGAEYIADPKTVNLDAPQSNIGVDAYTISIKYQQDTLAPVIHKKGDVADGVVLNENDENKQYTEISAHGIKFYDDTNSAKITVKVVDSNGIMCAYEELDGSYNAKLVTNPAELNANYVYEYNFAGVKFTANKAENYTVTYNVTDGANNIAVYSYVIRKATDAEAPNISVLGTTATIELGQTYYFKDIKVTDNGADPVTVSTKVVGAKVGNRSSYFNAETMEFTATEADTYTITITAADKEKNTSTKSIIVTVKDTTKPTLTLIGSTGDKLIVDEGEGTTDWDKDVFPEVRLPGFAVADAYQNVAGFEDSIGANGTITVTTPSDKTYTMDINGVIDGENPLNLERRATIDPNSYYFYFTPTERGHYTINYVAEDKSGNKSDKEVIDVYIGDTEIPQIYLTEDLQNTLKKGFVIGQNDQLIINPEARLYGETGYTSKDLYVKDNFNFKSKTDGANNKYVTVSVSVVNENNNTVSQKENDDGLVYYEFDKAGTYTITFTVTDSVGNVGTLTKNFKVTAKTATSSDATRILGTVLIVVSIVILAGVVIYFVRGTKYLPKKNKKAAKKAEKKSENKD